MNILKKIRMSLILLVIGVFFISGCFFTTKHEITFKTNGGSKVKNVIVKNGNKLEKPENPTKEGFVFDGWYVNGEEFNFDEKISEDMTLVAKWSQVIDVNESEGSAPDDGTQVVADDAGTTTEENTSTSSTSTSSSTSSTSTSSTSSSSSSSSSKKTTTTKKKTTTTTKKASKTTTTKKANNTTTTKKASSSSSSSNNNSNNTNNNNNNTNNNSNTNNNNSNNAGSSSGENNNTPTNPPINPNPGNENPPIGGGEENPPVVRKLSISMLERSVEGIGAITKVTFDFESEESNVDVLIDEDEYNALLASDYNSWGLVDFYGYDIDLTEEECTDSKMVYELSYAYRLTIAYDGNIYSLVYDEDNSKWSINYPVAQIVTDQERDVRYLFFATLKDALSVAQDGDTVTLLKDINLDETLVIESYVTIDGNNKTITVNNLNDIAILSDELINDTYRTGDITLTNITINGTYNNSLSDKITLGENTHISSTPTTPNTGEENNAPGNEENTNPGSGENTGEENTNPGNEENTNPGAGENTGEENNAPGNEENTNPGTGENTGEENTNPGNEENTNPGSGENTGEENTNPGSGETTTPENEENEPTNPGNEETPSNEEEEENE